MKRCCWMIWLIVPCGGGVYPPGAAGGPASWDSDQTAMPATSGLPAHAVGTLPALPPTRAPGERVISPTPNPPKVLPTIRTDPDEYIVQTGDTLGKISKLFDIAIETLIEANGISNPDLISAGQTLIIPVPSPQATGSSFKIIPDSELVFGPMSATLDVFDFVKKQGGFLSVYYDTDHNGETFTGAGHHEVAGILGQSAPAAGCSGVYERMGDPDRKGSIDYPLTSKEDWRVGLSQPTTGNEPAKPRILSGRSTASRTGCWRTAGLTLRRTPSIPARLACKTCWQNYTAAGLIRRSVLRVCLPSMAFLWLPVRCMSFAAGSLNPDAAALRGWQGLVVYGRAACGLGNGSAWAALDFARRWRMELRASDEW